MDSVLVVMLSGLVVVMVTVQGSSATITSKRLSKLGDTIVVEGDALVSREVKTNLECSAICNAVDCLGYTLTAAGQCTAYSNITSITQNQNLGALLYSITLGMPCAFDEECSSHIKNSVCVNNTCQCSYGSSPVFWNTSCEYAAARKDEACVTTSQCTLTSYTVCLNTTRVCGCQPEAIEKGDLCTSLHIGEPCSSTAQCLLGLNNSTCDGTCKCITNFVPSSDNSMCKYDYAAGGFTTYRGRWALFISTGPIPSSWDVSWLFCFVIQAKMFTPKDIIEWNYLKQMASSLILTGNFYMPINNKGGNLVWNNGSSASGVSFLPWTNGEEGKTKLGLFSNCGYAEYILNIQTLTNELNFHLVSCIDANLAIYACEAEIN
ncbi:prion-like-(Q/N-rich) domain-bearing protein 25 [Eriocheir sinensis]|uniref:prion-like-(Q/N-rich) domain-bearing protein 25 n=1 Tax=Eriocheir sinensis TaxID=95602 RepID=UPI0021C84238|nr:prion-like-(Q/N-rich) domain-bearing protein 25 [Eriocheir sinensis]